MKVQLDAPKDGFFQEVVLDQIPREGDTLEWMNDTEAARSFLVHRVVWFLGTDEPCVRLVLR